MDIPFNGVNIQMLLYNRFENLDLFGPFDVFALAEKLSAMQTAYCIFKLLSPFDRTISYNVEENDVLAYNELSMSAARIAWAVG